MNLFKYLWSKLKLFFTNRGKIRKLKKLPNGNAINHLLNKLKEAGYNFEWVHEIQEDGVLTGYPFIYAQYQCEFSNFIWNCGITFNGEGVLNVDYHEGFADLHGNILNEHDQDNCFMEKIEHYLIINDIVHNELVTKNNKQVYI